MKTGHAVIVFVGIAVVVGFLVLVILSNRSERERLWGFIDASGAEIVPIEFDDARSFANGRAAVSVDGAWGFITRDGAVVIEPQYAAVGDFSAEGMAWAEKDGTVGYLSTDGRWEIEPTFHAAYRFTGRTALAGMVVGRTSTRISGSMSNPIYSYGLITRDGAWLVEPLDDSDPSYWSAGGSFSEGLCAVQVGGHAFGYIDETGSMVIPARYPQAGSFSDGLALVRRAEGGYRLIDARGDSVLDLGVSSVTRGSDGFLTVRGSLNDQEGFFLAHVDGTIYQGPYKTAGVYNEGRLPVETKAGWVLIDSDGRQYGGTWDAMGTPGEGLVAIARSGRGLLSDYRWGYMDVDGRVAIEPVYDRARSFREGRALVAAKRTTAEKVNR